MPCTKLGRLVQQGKIKNLETIYLFSMPVKEYQIVEYFLGSALKDEVMKIMPVQKQTRAGQRTRFKAFVVVGDHNGHVGLGVKCAKEVRSSGLGRRRQAADGAGDGARQRHAEPQPCSPTAACGRRLMGPSSGSPPARGLSWCPGAA